MNLKDLNEETRKITNAIDDAIEVKVFDSVSGEIVDIRAVKYSHLNGGEIHIVVEMD